MSNIYLQPQFGIAAQLDNHDFRQVRAVAKDLTAWLQNPVNQIDHGHLLKIDYVGMNEFDKGLVCGVDIPVRSACVYANELFSQAALITPFENEAWGGAVESLSPSILAALEKLKQRSPLIASLLWEETPTRFFSAHS